MGVIAFGGLPAAAGGGGSIEGIRYNDEMKVQCEQELQAMHI